MVRGRIAFGLVGGLALLVAACTQSESPTGPSEASGGNQPVYVAVFTHIEDNTPSGAIGSDAARAQYLSLRSRLIEMATLARRHNVKWSLQPDWKYLLAAQAYEDASATASTGGVNLFKYLHDTLGAAIDPHSHESGAYNYSDVAYLLSTFGVGGTSVVGGHIWDPSLPQFSHWERFRVAQAGQMYPSALWRGDTLMGSGTPNHVNDPIVSGIWRPQDPTHYWTDDPAGNIVAVGAFKGDLAGIGELVGVSRAGQIAAACMMTSSIHVPPSDLTAAGGPATVEATVLSPLEALGSQVVSTDFTSIVGTWRAQYGSNGCNYRQ
jgi:hypothetical protein